MQIVFISVGKKHDENLRESIDDYTARIAHFCDVTWTFLPFEAQSDKDKKSGIEKEGKSIMDKLTQTDRVILLDEKGQNFTTVSLAESIETFQMDGIKRLVFVIGGAFGVSKDIRLRAQYTWALSKLTFPHMLVRLILAEQIYRATSILRGSKYHHS